LVSLGAAQGSITEINLCLKQINTLGTSPRIHTWEKLRTGYRATYVYFLNENPAFMALETKTMCHFCGSTVFWKLGYHPSLWIPGSAFKCIWSQNYGS